MQTFVKLSLIHIVQEDVFGFEVVSSPSSSSTTSRASPSPKGSSDFLTKLAEKATQLETKLVHQVLDTNHTS